MSNQGEFKEELYENLKKFKGNSERNHDGILREWTGDLWGI